MSLVFAWLVACGSPAPVVAPIEVAPEPVATAAAAVFANAQGEPICPVMGDVTPADKAVSSTVHDGVTYYFCCSSCEEMFAKDPQKYANGAFLAAEGMLPDGACAH
jgi:YHS domain-containing protein